MFPRADRPAHPARAWSETLRRGLDALIAFATLRDADTPPDHWADGSELAPSRSANGSQRDAGERTRHQARSGRAAAKTAREVGGEQRAIHPHRRALAAPVRQRRPGAVRPQPQPCLTPLATTRRARRPGVSTGRAR
jgi:hypothetical protein